MSGDLRPRRPLVVLWAAALSAGCASGVGDFNVEPGARAVEALQISRGMHGLLGAGGGVYAFRSDEFGDVLEDAIYVGGRLSRRLALKWGLSFTAGRYAAEYKADPDAADLVMYPVRATLELGSFMGPSLARWYVGAGGGYLAADDDENAPGIGDEWTAHAVAGFVFRNETLVATIVEAGHTWAFESGADSWTVTGGLSVQF